MDIKKMIAQRAEANLEKSLNEMKKNKSTEEAKAPTEQKPKARKTSAEHQREYRARKKAKKEACSNANERKVDVIDAKAAEVLLASCINSHKKNDQTAKADAGKLQLSMVPPEIIEDIAQVRMYGNKKYGDPNNWKNVENNRYVDALFRHFLAFLKDPESVDEESGIQHYKHMACNMSFICHNMRKKA